MALVFEDEKKIFLQNFDYNVENLVGLLSFRDVNLL
jgi:hypothetical protein